LDALVRLSSVVGKELNPHLKGLMAMVIIIFTFSKEGTMITLSIETFLVYCFKSSDITQDDGKEQQGKNYPCIARNRK
jgi:hypothetical protein